MSLTTGPLTDEEWEELIEQAERDAALEVAREDAAFAEAAVAAQDA